MKYLFLCSFLVLFSNNILAQFQECFELRTYTVNNEEQERILDDYLENALLPALQSVTIDKVGVFKEITPSESDSTKRIYVLVPYISLFQFETIGNILEINDSYKKAGKQYLETEHSSPAYLRIEKILMKAFTHMPSLSPSPLEGPRKDRVYELRSYESSSEEIFKNKMDMFNAGGEIALFDQLGFNAVFYGEVIAGPSMPNLMYMTTHKNMETRNANWKNFVESEGWKEMSSLEKYQNNVSHIDIILLYPTPYSAY